MQKFNLILLLGIFLSAQLSAQTRSFQSSPNQVWLTPDKDISAISYLNQLQRSNGDQATWTVQTKTTDQLNMTHYKANQRAHDIVVEGAELLIHEKEGYVQSANGLIVSGSFEDPVIQIQESNLDQIMDDLFPVARFYHDDPAMEALIKEIKGDNASFTPQPDLVYFDINFSKDATKYQLAWKVEIWLHDEIDHRILYIDAQNGNLLWDRPMTFTGCAGHDHDHGHIHSTSCEAMPMITKESSGFTFFNGVQGFTSDSLGADSFRLFDATRGRGVWTRNALRTNDTRFSREFLSDSNFWDMRNAFQDEAALDAHWGAEQTFDFWKNEYGWESYDGDGSMMISYVHWDVNWVNASWNGMFARFGDGNQLPLTYIDITAHEFAHGLTGTTSGLIYRDESGALNESFSDIFGTAVEFYALEDEAFWTLGRPSSPFRDMSEPNRFGHPDTYLGDEWFTGAGDNGGVHSNSGVQNFWFYLLCEGGSGTNDNGSDYVVDSIGMQKASAISFRNLTVYLTPSSNYFDARYGALAAAKDLFGPCSPEVEAVAQAWAAVGIGSPEVTTDLELVSAGSPGGSCGLEGEQTLSASFTLNPTGCDIQMDSGDVVMLGFQVNDEPAVEEAYTLEDDFSEGDILTYEFDAHPDFSAKGLYTIRYWIHTEDDKYTLNDTIGEVEVRNPVTLASSPSSVIFRTFTLSADSFYVSAGENAVAEMDIRAGNRARKGILGFKMTGQGASLNNIDLPFYEEENFEKNPTFAAKICFCVDAGEWDEARVAFDYRQLYSAGYERLGIFTKPEVVSSFRLLLDGEQIGDQYHPQTYTSDPWKRDTININEGAGRAFEFCFEGKHFIDRATDQALNANSGGDNTYLDEIVFYDPFTVSNVDVYALGIEVSPNPGREILNISFDRQLIDGDVSVHISGTDGRLLRSEIWSGQSNQQSINTRNWPAGSYVIQLKGQGWTKALHWVKQ